jgi:hypothetical protein
MVASPNGIDMDPSIAFQGHVANFLALAVRYADPVILRVASPRDDYGEGRDGAGRSVGDAAAEGVGIFWQFHEREN